MNRRLCPRGMASESRRPGRPVRFSMKILVAALVLLGCNRDRSDRESRGTRGALAPDIDLGYLPPGGRETEIIEIKNDKGRSLTIDRWQTTCECVTIEPAKTVVPAAGTAMVRVTADFSDDPKFAGRLRVEVVGLTSDARPALEFDARLRVLTAAEYQQAFKPLASAP